MCKLTLALLFSLELFVIICSLADEIPESWKHVLVWGGDAFLRSSVSLAAFTVFQNITFNFVGASLGCLRQGVNKYQLVWGFSHKDHPPCNPFKV